MDVLDPSLRGKRNLTQLLDAWATTRPEKVHASIPSSSHDMSQGFRHVTHRQIRDAADTFAWWLVDTYGPSGNFETIAYIGLQDLRYAVVFFGAIKAGYKSLFVSPRNPPNTNISLLQQTKCTHFLHAAEMASTVQAVTSQAADIITAQVPSFDHWLDSYKKPFPYEKSFEDSKWDPILVLHSSGSTGIPRPIQMCHGYFTAMDTQLRKIPGRSMSGAGTFNFDGGGSYYSPFPQFHLAGVQSVIYTPVFAREASVIIGLPDRPPSPQLIMDIIKYQKPRALYSPPSIIEVIGQMPEGMELLKTCEFIIYAGGPLSQACGDQLTREVKLSTVYGSTETGGNHFLQPYPEDWQYIEFHPDFYPRMEPTMDNASELVFSQDDPNATIRGISWTHPHLREYRTRDMFLPHPSKPSLWRFYGRNDDIIVFSNGAKYNPVPAEDVLLGSDNVSGVLIIGDGRTQALALIEPKEEPSSNSDFIEELWPYVERANEISQKQGHLVRSKVALVSPAGLIRAPKGTVVRSLTRNKYKNLIDKLYANENLPAPQFRGPTLADASSAIQGFIRECVQSSRGLSNIQDEDDFYVHGLDSVQTAELVKILKNGLKPQYGELQWLTVQIIFDFPTVRRLATAIEHGIKTSSLQGVYEGHSIGRTSPADTMQAMIAKYRQAFAVTNGSINNAATAGGNQPGLNVILTGSTGSLGMRILQNLVNDTAIESITCLYRRRSAESQIIASLDGPGTKKVETLQAQFGEKRFGLGDDIFADLQRKTDVVIHSAWTVDFNHSLASFEPVHIRGVVEFLDFSSSSSKHPRNVFVSSISAVANWIAVHDHEATVPESVPSGPLVAAGSGYGQSKYVSERILANATHDSSGVIPTTILRVGQIAGPVGKHASGPAWSTSEWFPSLLQTSKALGYIPENLPAIDWIPVDHLGAIVCEITKADISKPLSAETEVHNLVNPHKASWDALIGTVQTRFGGADACIAIPLEQWVHKLHDIAIHDEEALVKYPALKILPFFQDVSDKQKSGKKMEFAVNKSIESSKTFSELQAVGTDWLEQWMDQWKL